MLEQGYLRACVEAEARMRARGAVSWDQAKPGDLLLDGSRMVRRRIRTKREAIALAAEKPGRRWMLDGPRMWGVTETTPKEPAMPEKFKDVPRPTYTTGERRVQPDRSNFNVYAGSEEYIATFANRGDAVLDAAAPKLLAALIRLRDCPDVNLDTLEDETIAALDQAHDAIEEALAVE